MKLRNLILSDHPSYRVTRHLLFWTVRFFLIFIYSYGSSFLSFLTSGETLYIYDLEECMQVGGYRLLLDMFFCYTVIYWLMPSYLYKKRYSSFALLLVAEMVVVFLLSTLFITYYYNLAAQGPKFYHVIWLHAIHYIMGGSPVVCIGFLGIRLLKTWYREEEKKIAITREHAKAELQLLKAQIHPHFLFNTLNNIYSFTLADRDRAAKLADQLSGMMDYMSVEGEKEWVPVEKEIRLIEDYMSLEKVRYDQRLDISIDITGDFQNKLIAPLLLIPFAENCFKHGASLMRGKQWVKLMISIQDDMLNFELSNSKPASSPVRHQKNGIGLANVKKRLQLIYPDKHSLHIESTDTVYKVNLKVKLLKQPVSISQGITGYQTQPLSYA